MTAGLSNGLCLPGLLRIVIQPVRLFRRDLVDLGDRVHLLAYNATTWRLCVEMRPTAQDIQGHQVSVPDDHLSLNRKCRN